MIVNFLNPNPLELIRQERVLIFESDSLFSPVLIPDSLPLKNDSSLISTNNPDSLTIKQPNKISHSPDTSKEVTKPNIKENTKPDSGFAEPKAIHLNQAFNLYNQGVTFIDARESEEFADGHILNAVSIPFYEYEENEYKLKSIKKEQPIVVYCAGTDCDLSILLGDQLFEMGYKKTYIFFGGWNEWIAAGYPAFIKPAKEIGGDK